MDYLSENEMIINYARELKINVLQNELEDFITLATQENWGCRTLIARILEKEMEIRVEKRRKQRVRIAGFPQMKYLQELIRGDLPKDAQMVIPELETLEFIKEGRNVVLYGNPGTGKTHIATAFRDASVYGRIYGLFYICTTSAHTNKGMQVTEKSKAVGT